MSSLVSRIHDAAVSSEAWPQALEALTDAIGVASAALIISDKSTGNVDETCFSGLSAGFKSEYVRHYAAVDPYSPLLDGSWKTHSECLPNQLLRKSEWYNDFCVEMRRSRYRGGASSIRRAIALCSVFTQQIGRTFNN
jgi:hypothetical protein